MPVDAEQRLRVRADAEDEGVGVVTVADELPLRGSDEVVPDAVGVAGERRTPHRVRDVVVEAREEPEAVLARQVPPPAGRRCRRTGMLRALPPQAVGSKTVTSKPRSTSSCAAARPAMPPPRTATLRPADRANAGGAPSCPIRAADPTTAEDWSSERRVSLGVGGWTWLRAGARVGHVVISRDVDSSTVTTTLSRSGHAAVQPGPRPGQVSSSPG